jgi:protein-tyrosine phosphatase
MWKLTHPVQNVTLKLFMVDIHHHLLHGLDDGATDLETSVAMARIAVEDGITHVVATPHASGSWAFDAAVNAAKLAELREALARESIALTVATGCDFHLSYDNIKDAVANPRKYTVNSTRYLLVELPDVGLSPQLGEIFFELRVAGMVPILTHPERNPTLQRDPKQLEGWLREGLLIQVTAGSVLSQMGKSAELMAHKLLADRWVHFLATDAHNLDRRAPRMAEARDLVAKRYGADYAGFLCTENPLAVFEDRPLPDQPDPLRIFDDYEDVELPWWKRLFRR